MTATSQRPNTPALEADATRSPMRQGGRPIWFTLLTGVLAVGFSLFVLAQGPLHATSTEGDHADGAMTAGSAVAAWSGDPSVPAARDDGSLPETLPATF